MEQTGHSEGTQGDKKEVLQFSKQVKKRNVDPNLKEFIDNAIVPILVKEYHILDRIEAAVRKRLAAAGAQAAPTFRKGKP